MYISIRTLDMEHPTDLNRISIKETVSCLNYLGRVAALSLINRLCQPISEAQDIEDGIESD